VKEKQVFFVHTGLATFVKSDLDILSENYKVVAYYYKPSSKIFDKIWNVFKSFFNSAYQVVKSDIVFVWFGGFHGFFPVLFAKIFKKKSIVIVGGYDASYVPSIKYGVFYHGGFQMWVTKKVYQWVTYICPVDESLVRSTNYYADPSGVGYKTGILNHLDLDERKIRVIHLGFDDLSLESVFKEENLVLSVAVISNIDTFFLKGYQHIFEIAKQMPEVRFISGNFGSKLFEQLLDQKPNNMTLLPIISFIELQEYYKISKVIFQPSITESFCSVLVEGMIHGCVPVSANVGSIKRTIGSSGFVLETQSITQMKKAIELALQNSNVLAKDAHQQALHLYPLSKRKDAIYSIIEV
jgi:glycosyltransferase involved in cell wall biosynthesis